MCTIEIDARAHRLTHRGRRRSYAAVAVVAVVALAVGCNEEDRRELGEEDARDALSAQVEQVLDEQGLELDGDLDCTADVAEDGTATANCTGTDADGAAVVGTFAGTADVDAETCNAQLVVTVADAAVAEVADVDCFAVD